MRTLHLRRKVGVGSGVLALVIGFAVPFLAAAPAHAASCSGTSYTWTGNGDGRSWTDAQNWNPSSGTPGSNDSASIESSGGEVFIDNPHSVCDLNLTSDTYELFFHPGAGITVSNDLTITGDPTAPVHWDGSITVNGTTSISGSVEYDPGAFTFPDNISYLTSNVLDISGGSNVDLQNGATDLRATTADIGTSTIWSNGSSASDDIGQLQIDGSLTLGGDVDAELDVVLHNGATLDLAGHTLDVNSHSYSWWSNATVESSSGHGVVKFRDGTWLLLDNTVTLGSGVKVRMQDDSRLSDSAHYAGVTPGESPGSAGTLAGHGNLEWVAGHIVGNVTFGAHLTTTLDGRGSRRIEQQTGTVLTNKGRMIVVDGQLDVPNSPGHIVNDGGLVLDAGVTVTGSGVQTDIVNNAGGTVLVMPSPVQPTAKTAVLEATLANHGTINVPHGLTLQLNGGGVNALRPGGTLTGGGTLNVTDETRVLATGTTTITGGSTLLYDGYNSYIEAGTVTAKGKWTATATFTTPPGGHGTLAWRQGHIDGHLGLTGALSVRVTDPGGGATRDLGGSSTYPHTQVTLGSPTVISNATVRINNNSAVLVSGAVTLAGHAPALGTGYGDASQGAILHILKGGSVSVAAPTKTVHPAASMDYPVVNSGTVTVPAGSKLLLPTSFKQTGGSLRGGGRVVGNVVVTGGSVRPSTNGSQPAALTIAGAYRQGAHAKLVLLVAGARRHDRLVVTGTASLAGTIAPVLKSGYRPGVGTKFVALSAAARSGKFGRVVSAGVPRGTRWKQLLRAKAVSLKLVR